jgi:putative heme-binding domain-containing protein
MLQDLGQLFGTAESLDRCLALVTLIADPDEPLGWQPAALAGLLQGLRARKLTEDSRSALLAIVSGESSVAREARASVDALLTRASAVAGDDSRPVAERQAAIELVGLGDWQTASAPLVRLVDPREPAEVQVAAVRALGQFPDAAGSADHLLDGARWKSYTPLVREAVLTLVVARDSYAMRLLDAVARGEIAASALGLPRRARLEGSKNAAVGDRARALFAQAGAGSAGEAYARLRPVVETLTGDAPRGATLFTAHCRACHAFDGAGGSVGPDLSGIRSQPVEAILQHLIVPDAEIAAGYETYSIETKDGRTIVGRIESETPASLTVRDVASQAHAILRTGVASIAAIPGSLMPAGFDQSLSAEALADLIAYVKSVPARGR